MCGLFYRKIFSSAYIPNKMCTVKCYFWKKKKEMKFNLILVRSHQYLDSFPVEYVSFPTKCIGKQMCAVTGTLNHHSWWEYHSDWNYVRAAHNQNLFLSASSIREKFCGGTVQKMPHFRMETNLWEKAEEPTESIAWPKSSKGPGGPGPPNFFGHTVVKAD